MHRELRVNGKLIELQDDIRVGITKQAQNPELVDKQQNDYTSRFKIPITESNQKAFGWSNDLQSDTNFPYVFTDCIYTQDGVEIFPYGILFLDQVEDDLEIGFFEAQIFSGFIGLFEAMGNKSIRDLDLSSFNHKQSVTAVTGSQSNTWNDCYIYDVIRRGFENDLFQNLARYMYPSVFIRKLYEEIFIQNGFTRSGTLPSQLDDFIIPYTEDESNVDRNYQEILRNNSARASKTSSQEIVSGAPQRVSFENESTRGNYDLLLNFNGITGVFSIDFSNYSDYTVECKASLIVSGTGEIEFFFQETNKEIGNTRKTVSSERQILDVSATIRVQSGINIGGGFFNPDIECFAREISGNPVIEPGSTIEFNVKHIETSFGGTTPLVDWDISENLPDIKQSDIVKFISVIYGLYYTPDQYTGVYETKSFDEVINNANAGSFIDWSDKLDQNKPIKKTFKFQDFARENNFKYKGDNEEGNGSLNINDLTLDPSADIYEAPFNATKMFSVENPSYNFNNPNIDMVSGSDERLFPTLELGASDIEANEVRKLYLENDYNFSKADPRILFVQRNQSPEFIVLGDFIPLQTQMTTVARSRFTELSFENNFLQNYYNTYKSIINKTKKIECFFNLNINDIVNYNPSMPIKVDNLEGLYFLSKIENWESSQKSTRCILYRLN